MGSNYFHNLKISSVSNASFDNIFGNGYVIITRIVYAGREKISENIAI